MGEWDVDEILWCMKWSAPLVPELAMIPDRSVFLRSSLRYSLTATAEGKGADSDIWEAWEDKVEGDIPCDRDDLEDVDEVVEGICCYATHEPGPAKTVSQDPVLFV